MSLLAAEWPDRKAAATPVPRAKLLELLAAFETLLELVASGS
jgi:hypothetical protein